MSGPSRKARTFRFEDHPDRSPCYPTFMDLGAEEYKRQLQSLGLSLLNEHEDEGQNHYYDAIKAGRVAQI